MSIDSIYPHQIKYQGQPYKRCCVFDLLTEEGYSTYKNETKALIKKGERYTVVTKNGINQAIYKLI